MIGWLLAGLALAQEAPIASPLALDDVLRSVEAHFPLVHAARADLDAREAKRQGALSVWDPTIEVKGWWQQGPYDQGVLSATVTQATPLWGLQLQGGYRLGLGKFPGYEGKLETGDTGEGWLDLTLPLLEGGFTDARRTAIAVARAELQGGEAAVEAAQVLAARDARSAWFRWLGAGERLAVTDQMLRVAQVTRDGVARRVQAGDLAPIELTDAERIVLERQARRIGAARDVAAAAQSLGLFLRADDGAPAPPLHRLPPTLERPAAHALDTEDALVATALQAHPDLRALDARLDAAAARVRLGRNGVLPELDVLAGIERDENPEPEEQLEVKVGGVLKLSAAQRPALARLAEAEAEVDGLQARRAWAADKIVADVRAARLTVEATHERARVAQRAAELADELARAERRRFELGDADLFRVYQRERSAMDALLEAVDAWTAHQLAAADLLAVSGRR